MSKTNTFENELLLHIFQNAAISLIGDASGLPASATEGSLYLSLHSADPGEAGDQATSEIVYTSYVRLAAARNSSVWTVAGSVLSPAADFVFATASGGTPTIATHVGIGASSAGAGKLLYRGSLTPAISIATGVIPRITTQTTLTED